METISFWIEMSPEATNAQQNVVPDINVRNAILSTDVAKIKKDAETAIEKDVENSVKVQYSLQGNSMSADEQRIVDEAKANGTYLKAPNGKASNLNERQWIQVRTKAFKDWFGDWELAEIYKLISNLSAETLVEMPIDKTSKEVFQGLDTAINKIDGTKIKFFTSAYKKVIKLGGVSEKIIATLPKIFENSVLAYSEADNRGGLKRPDGTYHRHHPSLEQVRNYIGKVIVDGIEYYVRFTIHMQRNNNGLHSYFATDVSLYRNDSVNSLSESNLLGARVTENGIINTKLETFLKNAKFAQLDRGGAMDCERSEG